MSTPTVDWGNADGVVQPGNSTDSKPSKNSGADNGGGNNSSGDRGSNIGSETTREALRMSISSAVSGGINEVLFYGLDSYKITKQAGVTTPVAKLFHGIHFFPAISAFPSYGSFFFFYSFTYSAITSSIFAGWGPGVPVLFAATLSSIPATLISVPADVMKKQYILPGSSVNSNNSKSVTSFISSVYRQGGIRSFFLGWQANIFREVPTTAIEMSLYEGIGRLYYRYLRSRVQKEFNEVYAFSNRKSVLSESNSKTDSISDCNMKNSTSSATTSSSSSSNHKMSAAKSSVDIATAVALQSEALKSGARASTLLSKYEAACVGFLAGSLSSIVTCPIDCVNTRVKCGEMAHVPLLQVPFKIVQQDGIAGLFRGLLPRATIAGFGGLTFWYMQAAIKSQLIAYGL